MAHASADQTALSAVEFGIQLRQAQHVLSLRIDDALRPTGLNLGLWRVMRELAHSPGASAAELGRASLHAPQTVGGLLQRLEDQGLVERSDGRGRIVENHLTPQGVKTLRRATAAADKAISSSLAGIDAADIAQASRFLTQYVAALTSAPEGED